MLRAEFSLPSITSDEATPERKAPIRVKFEIPYFTVSGIQVSNVMMIWKKHAMFLILVSWSGILFCLLVTPCILGQRRIYRSP